jgi:hypothetical protein
MHPKKLTPLEILQKQKAGLQVKSDELAVTIENRAKYVQQNFAPLLRNTVIESAVSKMPPQLRNLTGNFLLKEKKANTQNLSLQKVAQGFAISITEIAPFFLKGKKGALISILLKQVIKWIT